MKVPESNSEVITINRFIDIYELKKLGIPSVKWKKYNKNTEFDDDKIWTVKTVFLNGKNVIYPKLPAIRAKKAKKYAEDLRNEFNQDDIIIYYPYFVSDICGNIKITLNRIFVDIIRYDIWHSYKDGRKDTIILTNDKFMRNIKKDDLLNETEIRELLKEGKKLKTRFKKYLLDGKSIMLEWCHAIETDLSGNKKGDPYLALYDGRIISSAKVTL